MNHPVKVEYYIGTLYISHTPLHTIESMRMRKAKNPTCTCAGVGESIPAISIPEVNSSHTKQNYIQWQNLPHPSKYGHA